MAMLARRVRPDQWTPIDVEELEDALAELPAGFVRIKYAAGTQVETAKTAMNNHACQ